MIKRQQDREAADYEIEKIWAAKIQKGKWYYLIQWNSYPKAKDDTWEPEEHIYNKELIEEYTTALPFLKYTRMISPVMNAFRRE